MKYLHQIGPRSISANFNTLEEILAEPGPISFDGIYETVYTHYKALKGKDVTFFVSGKYLGGDNAFDVHTGQPLTSFCRFEQIEEMAAFLDAKIGYHGWAHLKCHELKSKALIDEMKAPLWLQHSKYFNWEFAWPHGDFNDDAIAVAHGLGYRKAWSTHIGNGNQYALVRRGIGRD